MKARAQEGHRPRHCAYRRRTTKKNKRGKKKTEAPRVKVLNVMIIDEVAPHSWAAKSGITSGDIIVEIEKKNAWGVEAGKWTNLLQPQYTNPQYTKPQDAKPQDAKHIRSSTSHCVRRQQHLAPLTQGVSGCAHLTRTRHCPRT